MGRRWALGAMAALVLALAGFFLTLRPARPAPGSADVTFTQEMLQHHDQAVSMSILLRQHAAHPSVRSLALDIQLSQLEQMQQMKGWLQMWEVGAGPALSAQHARAMGMANPAELLRLRDAPDPEAQRLFLTLMIRHHRGAVAMVRELPTRGVHPNVARLARQIEVTQAAEINTMTALLRKLGGDAPQEQLQQDVPAPASGHH